MSATTSSKPSSVRTTPEVRLERGEGVVGDLGLGRRDPGDQRRLPDVRQPDQRHVGHQLQLESQPALLPRLALLGEGRGPPPVRQEAGVAPPAPPAPGGQPAVARPTQVGQHLAVAVLHDGALRHRHLEVVAPVAVLALAPAVRAVGGPPVGMVAERQQGGDVAVGHQPHVAALAAVAAVGPAPGDVGLAPEGDAARAAVAASDVEPAFVDELGAGRHRPWSAYPARRRGPGAIGGRCPDLAARRPPEPSVPSGLRRPPLGCHSRSVQSGPWPPSGRRRGHPPWRGTRDGPTLGSRRPLAGAAARPRRQPCERRPGAFAAAGGARGARGAPARPGRHPGPGRGRPPPRRGGRPVPHLLRARPGPHPARQRLPAPGRQDPGLRLPRRPPAHPAHPCARGGPGGHVDRPCPAPQRRRSPRPSPWPTTAATAPAGTPPRTRSPPTSTSGYDHAVWGADVVLAPLNLCAETLDGVRNHSWSRPAPGHPRGRGGQLGRPHRLRLPRLRGRRLGRAGRARELPALVVGSSCGDRPPRPAGRLHRRVVDAAGRHRSASACSSRWPRRWPPSGHFNYERIYLRPASVDAGQAGRAAAAGPRRALRRQPGLPPARPPPRRHRRPEARRPSAPRSPTSAA